LLVVGQVLVKQQVVQQFHTAEKAGAETQMIAAQVLIAPPLLAKTTLEVEGVGAGADTAGQEWQAAPA
jgi:hypothetical protein